MSRHLSSLKLPEDFAAYTRDRWTTYDPFYNAFTQRWKRVIDFIRSVHWRWGEWNIDELLKDPELATLDQRKLKQRSRFPVFNLSLAVYQDYVTQWLRSRVRFSAVPSTPDPDDVASAELAEQTLAALWDILEMEQKRIEIASWLAATGNADVRVYWNNDTGNLAPLAVEDEEGNLVPINPLTGQPDPTMTEPIMVDAGEIGVEVVPPIYCRYPLDIPGSVMVGVPMGYEQVAAKYGEDVAKGLSYGKLSTITTYFFDNVLLDEATMVIEHYLPRSSRFPQGLWWTASEDGRIIVPPAPLPSRYVPVVHFRWIPLPGHPTMGLTPLYDITFLNKGLDRLLKQTEEWVVRATPLVLRKEGDGLREDELKVAEPFSEIRVRPGMEPTILEVPNPPPEYRDLRREFLDSALVIGGYRFMRPDKLDEGSVPPSLRIQNPQVQSGDVVALSLLSAKAAWQKLGYILLDFVGTYYSDERAIALVGKDRTYQWREFRGSDLANIKANIHVDEEPLFPWNRTELRAAASSLLGSPLASLVLTKGDGQVDKEKLEAIMEAVGFRSSLQTLDPDVLAARNENNLLRQGISVEVLPTDDHRVHIEEHSRETKTLLFRTRPKEIQDLVFDHIARHEQALAEEGERARTAMIEQEHAMRAVREAIESDRTLKEVLGERLIDLFVDLIKSRLNVDTEKRPRKE